MTADYRLRLLGPFALFAADGRRVVVSSRKSVALIALVAMARAGERNRSWLQGQLWGERPANQARASLRRELTNLRSCLADAGAEALLETTHSIVRLNLSLMAVDVRELEHNVSNGLGCDAGNCDQFLEGVDIPAEEAFEDWLREQRSRVDELVERSRSQEWERQTAAPRGDSPESLVHADAADSTHLRPSIAVLRLTGAADGLSDEIADGVTDEIGVSLSRYSTLFVVRAGAVAAEGARLGDRVRICRELGVRYLLEGGVQQRGGVVRVSVRLIDGAVGEQVWAERFDGGLDELFALQERIADVVAPLIDASIEQAERRRAATRPVSSTDAYHIYWRANALFRTFDRDSVSEAASLAVRVLEIEPENAWASSLAAFCNALAYGFSWTDNRTSAREAALRYYDVCMAQGADDPFVLGYAAGTILAIAGDLSVAEHHIDRALQIHPRASSALFWGGWVDVASGHAQRGLERFRLALSLNPRSGVRPHTLTGIGICLLMLERHDEASEVLRDASLQLPRHGPTLAAFAIALFSTNRHDEGLDCLRRLNSLGGITAVAGIIRDPALLDMLSSMLAGEHAAPVA